MSCPSIYTNPSGWVVCNIQNSLSGVSNDILSGVSKNLNSAENDITGAVGTSVSNLGTSLVNNISSSLSGVGNTVSSDISPLFAPVESGLNNISSTLTSIPKSISGGLSNLQNYLGNEVSNVESGVNSIGSAVSKLPSDLSSGFSALGTDMSKDIYGAVSDAITPIMSAFDTMFKIISGGFTDVVNGVTSLGGDLKAIETSIVNFTNSAMSFINNFFTNIKNDLQSGLTEYVVDPLERFYNGYISPVFDYIKTNFITPLMNDMETFLADLKTLVSYVEQAGGDIITAVNDVNKYGGEAYSFLTSKTIGLPNWVWVAIGTVGGIAGLTAGGLYLKGYITEEGAKSAINVLHKGFNNVKTKVKGIAL